MLLGLIPSSPPGVPPDASRERDPRNEDVPAPDHSLIGKRVVIVEDEGITQMQLGRIVRQVGMSVVGTAFNGRDAVEIVLATHPDLVLMDIKMPQMSGLEASQIILAQERVCIVMLTAYADEEYRQRARELGTCGYVVKPIQSTSLVPALREALQRFGRSPDPLA